MNWIKRHMFRINLRSLIILALGVMMDIAFRYYATSHSFPIWFDSVGTIYVAAALGPFGGALTGILMSLVLGVVDVSAILYMFVSVAVGVTAGLTYPKQGREKRPELYSIGIVGLYTALVAVLLSTPLNLFYYNGYTGNTWGDAMVDQLSLVLNSRIPCALVGEGFVDFPDKVLSVFLTSILIGITEIIDAKFSEKKDRKQITSILLFISVGAFAAASLIAPLPVYAEEENKAPDYLSEYASTYYGMDDGLASIEINCITQTGDGYIWVGGYSGLYVFDGTRFYQMDLGKGISSVTTLFTASNGDLWIGTNDVGVVRYSVQAKTSKVYGVAAGLPSESVRSICEDADGNIYVGTVVSPCVITASGVVGKYEDLAGVSNITSMSTYGNWVSGTTGGGALFLMNSDGLCQIIDDGRLYRSLCWGRDGELLVGTTENELVHFSLQEDHLTERSVSEYPQHAYYNDIYHSPEEDGYLVCADDGMAYIDSKGKMTDLTTMSFNNSIKGAMKDYQGNLWFVSDKQGILKYSPNLFKNLGKVSGLPDRVANAVLLDGTDLYVGMDEGLFVIDTTTDTLKDTEYLSALSEARIRSLMKDSKGNIWVSVYGDEGLVEILPSGEMVFFNATNTSMPDSRMRSAIELLNGDIMAAGAFGIVCIRDGRVAYVLTEKDGLETPQILSLMQRPDGAVLAGSDGGGIYVIRDGAVTDNINAGNGLKSPVVLRIVHGKFGYIYVTSNALYYDNGEEVKPLDQFPYSNNYDIHIDDEGIAWVLSSAGIYLVDEIKLLSNEEYDYALLNYTRGLDASLTSNSWNAVDEQGMYLCCSDGVRYIDMKEYGRFEDDFAIDIHSFMGNGETITEQDKTYYVPAGVTKVEFSPAVLSYSMTNPLVHVYLEGMEDVDYTMKQNEMKEITLNGLPHGTYPLHVQILDEVDHSRVLKEAVFTVEKEAQLYEELYFKIYQYSVLLVFIIYMAWIVARMRNLSVINRQYDQIREAKDEAEMANKAKSRFLAQMSHEIRTPINAVLGMDEMILRESTEKEVLGYAADIYTAGQTLLALINDILDSSKIESGKMEILPVEYEVTSLIHDLYNMIAQRAEDKELRLIVDVDPHIPSFLYGDDVRVRQVITNILTNAIKYTPSGNVWFRVSGVRKSREIFILHVEVEDTGMGMRPEDVKRLFNTSFQRVNQEKTRYIEGTGLGLMITQQLLKLMGSKLEVFSEYEKGSKFYFDLEQKVVDPTPIGDFNERVMRSEVSVKKYNGFSAPDAQILVVDDNSMNRKVFKSLLKTTLIHITEAESGQEAIDLATEHFYDIIFMDHMMPEMDGVEAMHRIREIKGGPCANTPIIVLTANAVSGAKEMYKEEGFNGFISKPVVADKLEEAIKDALPADLIKAPIEEKEAPKKSAGMPDDLPMVEGLDWGFAWQHLPDLDVLKDTLAEFHELLPVHKKKLEGMYADILSEVEEPTSEERIKNAFSAYRIQVHSMKGAAATIGIVPLAGAAKILEFAARDEDPETIRALHPIFIKEWMSYADKLYGVFDIGIDRTEKIPGTPEIFHEESEVIRQALEDMDIDEADEHMEILKGYTFGEKADELIKELSAAVADLDEDAAAGIIASIQECI